MPMSLVKNLLAVHGAAEELKAAEFERIKKQGGSKF
tara:strand:- start:309 stop:416 length:108 start_codon:yes stop_codon:yes gene_type:complete